MKIKKIDMMDLYMTALESSIRIMKIASKKYPRSRAIVNHSRKQYAEAVKVLSDYVENRVKAYE